MTQIEKEETKNRMKALDAEEQQIALKVMPTEVLLGELERRISVQAEIINGVKAALRMGKDS